MDYWEIDIERVDEFNFLNEEAEEFTSRQYQMWEALVTWCKKLLNIIYEV